MTIEIFKLVRERCLLNHLNIRTEQHGEEQKPAIDLAFEFSSANNLLAKLHPDLRAAFYRKDDNRDLVEGDHLPALRFPLLGRTISWELEIPRTLLRLHGDTPEHDIVLGGGKTNKFKLDLLEGGTVKWHFRVQFSKPNEDAIAQLSRVLNQSLPISLESAEAEDEQTDLFDQVEQQAQAPMSDARQEAEAMFAKPGTDLTLQQDGGGVVDATFTPGEEAAPAAGEAAPAAAEAAPAASNVAPIGKGRRGGPKKVGNGANLE